MRVPKVLHGAEVPGTPGTLGQWEERPTTHDSGLRTQDSRVESPHAEPHLCRVDCRRRLLVAHACQRRRPGVCGRRERAGGLLEGRAQAAQGVRHDGPLQVGRDRLNQGGDGGGQRGGAGLLQGHGHAEARDRLRGQPAGEVERPLLHDRQRRPCRRRSGQSRPSGAAQRSACGWDSPSRRPTPATTRARSLERPS